jgi:hypothetical protein
MHRLRPCASGAIGTASVALLVYACRVTATALSGALTSSFRWLERATLLLVLVFVGHGAVTLANGALDFSAPIEAKAQVVAIDGVEVDLGRPASVSCGRARPSWSPSTRAPSAFPGCRA